VQPQRETCAVESEHLLILGRVLTILSNDPHNRIHRE